MEWDIAPAKKAEEDKPAKKKNTSKDVEGDGDGQITLF